MNLLKRLLQATALTASVLTPTSLEARGETLPYQEYFEEFPDEIITYASGFELFVPAHKINIPYTPEGSPGTILLQGIVPRKPETGCISYHIQYSTDFVNFKDDYKTCTSSEDYPGSGYFVGAIPAVRLLEKYSTIDPDTGERVYPKNVYMRVLIRDCKEHSNPRGNGR